MRKRRLIFVIILGAFVLGLAFFEQISLSTYSNISNRNNITYDPAHYSLPSSIGGYKTFAVLTSDNTACMSPGEKRLVLQASQENIQSLLSENDYAAIQHDLQQRGFADFSQSNVEIVGPDTTLDQFLNENEKWNEASKKYGCVTSAPVQSIPN